ncbi:MAG TPA: glycerophosphodiester phosphodiesterase family protein [Rhizomicrobium sp.]|nr:glycerophosphodiester phosphodiesterase family protein [Rhizomicrobium sp.]
MHPWTIAHRGGAQLMPENTLPAFADALARGCDGVELDVQLTRDGRVVIHHDDRLMADVARQDGKWLDQAGPRIGDLTWDELQAFDVGIARPGSAYALAHPLLQPMTAKVPRLEEVADLAKSAGRRFLLFVELKCAEGADPVALADGAYDVIAAKDFLDDVIFVGFDWRALVRIRARDPGAACWFTTDKLSGDARAVIDIIAAAGGEGWFPNFPDASPENTAYARTKKLKVGAWTVNRRDDMQRLSDLDALCTDRPDLLSALHGRA